MRQYDTILATIAAFRKLVPEGMQPEIRSVTAEGECVVVEFEGVPTAFTKDPFMLTFETEKAKVTGLEMDAPPPPAKPVRKAAPVGKKKK